MYTAEAEESLLAGKPDFVLDAIDNIDTKVLARAAPYRPLHSPTPSLGLPTASPRRGDMGCHLTDCQVLCSSLPSMR